MQTEKKFKEKLNLLVNDRHMKWDFNDLLIKNKNNMT